MVRFLEARKLKIRKGEFMKKMRLKKKSEMSAFGTVARENHDAGVFYNSKLYKNLKNQKVELYEEIDNPISKEILNKCIIGDARDMKDLDKESVHLMVTSPPYNVSKNYDQDLTLKEYLELLKSVFLETYRVLINGGRACVNIANIGRKPYIPLNSYIANIMIEIGYKMRGEIIWQKGAGAGVSTAWGSWQSASNPTLRDTHEYILIFSKNKYNREKKEAKENTISKEQFIEYTKSVWNMRPESAKRVKHPAPFPVELPYRLIQLYTFKNDIILDPFMGSGTSAIAAIKSNRKFIGYEINKDYAKLSNERVKEYSKQLKIF